MSNKISRFVGKINYKHLIIILILILSSSTFYYGDANSTIRQGCNLWHALFSGKIFEYYSNYGSAYSMTMIVIMGIWQFPLFLIEKIFGISVLEFFAFRVYGKLQLIIVAWIAATYVKKIATLLGMSEKRAEYALIMYLTSIPIMTTVCQVGQVDIFGMAFTVIAYYYLISNKNRWGFYLFFLLAVQCKYMAWFILVPVVLFIQKKLWKAVMIVAMPLLISFMVNIPFNHASTNNNETQVIDLTENNDISKSSIEDSYQEQNLAVSSIIGAGKADNGVVSIEFENFLGRPIDLIDSNFPIPLLFIVYVAICIVAFLKDPNEQTKEWWYLYWGFLGAISIITCLQLPYRMGYISFFTILFLLKQEQNFARKFSLEIIAYTSLIIGYFASYAWLYDLSNMRSMLIDNILPLKKFALSGIEDIRQMVLTNHMERLWSIFFAIFIVWIVVMLWISYPDRKVEYSSNNQGIEESGRLLRIRILVNLLLCNYAVVLYVFGVIRNIWIHFFG